MSQEAHEEDINKSVITCDLEGRIQTFNKGAQEIFGYNADEVIGKKRVSLFSPGVIVLGHIGGWLKAASTEGEFKTRTVFLRKDGTPFAADIRITPTFRDGQQIGFCGVTTPCVSVAVDEAMPPVGLGTRIFTWAVITRAPFLTASVMPVLLGAAWVAAGGLAMPFPWVPFVLALIGGMALHTAANVFNDHFDWVSGTDQANNDYFQPLSGGSRAIELRLISAKATLRVGWAALGIATLCGLILMVAFGRWALAFFGLFGAFSAFFYTAPPLRLAARRGIGELLIGLNFGPLMTAGTIYSLTGNLSLLDFVIGLPIGLLITAVLWINQFPDYEADQATGKINLVVALGKERARWGYTLLVVGAFVLVIAGVVAGLLPWGTLIVLAALPIAVSAVRVLFRHYADRALVSANQSTIKLHMTAGLLMSIGVLLSGPLSKLLN